MYDTIVVGARCAGSPTATLLARKGYRVLLVDKATFPSDTLSVHYIHQAGVARLARWGLLDSVAATGCPPVTRQQLDLGPFALVGAPPPIDGIATGYAPRRTVLDQILVSAAVAAGAELREQFSVKELVFEDGRVVGIRGRSRGGALVTERARLVVGADGLYSVVARAVQASAYETVPTRTCAYYAYWSGVPIDGVELYARPERVIIAAPTNDGQAFVIVYWPVAEFHEVRADIEGQFDRALELVPELAERLRGGTRVERFRGSADLPGYVRKPYGPGWALVGDAGYHKDPITAQGITDAFRDAELLAGAIDEGFWARHARGDALAEYERQRNATALPIYAMTCDMATLQPPPPDQQQLMAALQHDQEQTDRFFGTLAGTVSLAEFYAPDNVAWIIGAGDRMRVV